MLYFVLLSCEQFSVLVAMVFEYRILFGVCCSMRRFGEDRHLEEAGCRGIQSGCWWVLLDSCECSTFSCRQDWVPHCSV